MNKEKISLQEVADLFAAKASISKRAAEDFLKILFISVEEALLAGEPVKIRSFGTFKILWNEPRKSVNIQTGEEIILDGYYKASFIPETSLKDLVNEPYAHLQAVDLDADIPEFDDDEKNDIPLDPLRIFNEQASEIKDLISEIRSLSNNQIIEESEEKVLDVKPIMNKEKIERQYEEINEIKEAEKVSEEVKPDRIQNIEEIIFRSESVNDLKEEPVQDKPQENTSNFEFTTIPKSTKTGKKRNKKIIWIWILSIIFLIGVAKVSLYLFYPPFTKWADSSMINCKNSALDIKDKIVTWFTPSPKADSNLQTVVIPKNTIENDSISEEKPVDSLQILFDTPRIYPDFIATVRIHRGSRLALISKKYYGKSDFWVYIYEANTKRIPDPDKISSGTWIRIPKIDPRLIDASNPRCVRKARELHDLYVK